MNETGFTYPEEITKLADELLSFLPDNPQIREAFMDKLLKLLILEGVV